MIPKFVNIGSSSFNSNTIDYILVRDSDTQKDKEGIDYCISLTNKDYVHVELSEVYPIDEMEEYLSNFDFVTVKDDYNDVYSINTKNIFYIERCLDKFLRIHFKDSILVLLINEDKDAEDLIKVLTEWD